MLKWVSFKFTALFELLMMAETQMMAPTLVMTVKSLQIHFSWNGRDSGLWLSEVMQVVFS